MCDILPKSVHDALDKVEMSLSIPVLVVVGLCTLQFAMCHSMHVICIFKDILRKRAKRNKCPKKKGGCGLMDCLKALLDCLTSFCKPGCPTAACQRPKPKPACKRKVPKKRCSSSKAGGNSDNDFDDDDLLGLDDF